MCKLVVQILSVLYLLITLPPAIASSDRVALVIGNRDYSFSPLNNSVNDAQDMKAKLEKLGFEVIYYQNAPQIVMDSAVEEFGRQLEGRQTGLFYYAGHGVQYEGENYLIPVDFDGKSMSESALKYKSLNVGHLLETMKNAKSPVSIVILDACRTNPIKKTSRSIGFGDRGDRGLANISGPDGSLIAFATAPGFTSSDGSNGRNGIYTKHLLANIDTPGISVEEMFKRVRRGVRQSTGDHQTPWENSSLSGDFCFVNCRNDDDNVQEQAEKERLQQEKQQLEAKLKALQQERENAEQTDSEQSAQQRAKEQELQTLLQQKRDLEAKLKNQEQNAFDSKKLADEMRELQEQNRLLATQLKQSQQQGKNKTKESSKQTRDREAAEAQLQALLQQNQTLQDKLKTQEYEFNQRQQAKPEAAKPEPEEKPHWVELPPPM